MQFTVYRNADTASMKVVPYLLDVQSDFINGLATCVVVPLIAPARASVAAERLMPEFEVEGAWWVMDTAMLAAIPRKKLGRPVADLSGERFAILAALDFLTNGI